MADDLESRRLSTGNLGSEFDQQPSTISREDAAFSSVHTGTPNERDLTLEADAVEEGGVASPIVPVDPTEPGRVEAPQPASGYEPSDPIPPTTISSDAASVTSAGVPEPVSTFGIATDTVAPRLPAGELVAHTESVSEPLGWVPTFGQSVPPTGSVSGGPIGSSVREPLVDELESEAPADRVIDRMDPKAPVSEAPAALVDDETRGDEPVDSDTPHSEPGGDEPRGTDPDRGGEDGVADPADAGAAGEVVDPPADGEATDPPSGDGELDGLGPVDPSTPDAATPDAELGEEDLPDREPEEIEPVEDGQDGAVDPTDPDTTDPAPADAVPEETDEPDPAPVEGGTVGDEPSDTEPNEGGETGPDGSDTAGDAGDAEQPVVDQVTDPIVSDDDDDGAADGSDWVDPNDPDTQGSAPLDMGSDDADPSDPDAADAADADPTGDGEAGDTGSPIPGVPVEDNPSDPSAVDGTGGVDEPGTTDLPAAEAPVLILTDTSGDEDQGIPLDIAATSINPENSFSVTITGVPAGASLSAGTAEVDGTWRLEAADLDGLALIPPTDFSGIVELTVSATSIEGSGNASTTGALAIDVAPVADTPELRVTVEQVGTSSDGQTQNGSSQVGSPDAGMSGNMQLLTDGLSRNENIKTGADDDVLVVAGDLAGGNNIHMEEGDDILRIEGSIGKNVHVHGGQGSDVLQLAGGADAYEVQNLVQNKSGIHAKILDIETGERLLVNHFEAIQFGDGSLIGDRDLIEFPEPDTVYELRIEAASVDADGSESLCIYISGLPDGTQLNAGIRVADNEWRLEADELFGLSMTVPAGGPTDFSITVTATASEIDAPQSQASAVIDVVVSEGYGQAEGGFTSDAVDLPPLTLLDLASVQASPLDGAAATSFEQMDPGLLGVDDIAELFVASTLVPHLDSSGDDISDFIPITNEQSVEPIGLPACFEALV